MSEAKNQNLPEPVSSAGLYRDFFRERARERARASGASTAGSQDDDDWTAPQVTPPPVAAKPASSSSASADPFSLSDSAPAPAPAPAPIARQSMSAAPSQRPSIDASGPSVVAASPGSTRNIRVGDRSTYELLKQRNEALAAQNRELLQQIADMRDKYRSYEAEVQDLRARVNTEGARSKAETERQFAEERAQEERQLAEFRSRIQAQLEAAKGRAEAADSKAASLGGRLEALERERDEAIYARFSEAARAADAEARAENLAQAIATLKEEDKNNRIKLEKVEGDLNEANRLLAMGETEASQLRDNLAAAQSRTAAAESEVTRLNAMMESEKGKSARLESEKRLLEGAVETSATRAREARDAVLKVLGDVGYARDSVLSAHSSHSDEREERTKAFTTLQQIAAMAQMAMQTLAKPSPVGPQLEGALASLSGIVVSVLPTISQPEVQLPQMPSPVRRSVARALQDGQDGSR